MCSLLANELAKRGHNVIIVSQNNYYWQKRFFEISDNIRNYSMKRTLTEWFICRLFKSVRYDIRKYKKILAKNNINLIINVDTEMSLDTALANKDLGIKVISWEHFCYQRFVVREIAGKILDCLKSDVDHLVVLTKRDRELFISDSCFPAEKVSQIYNPSPIENTQVIHHQGKKVLAMGRLAGEKGFDMLLKIWKIIEDTCSDWSLEIVGEGPEKESLISQKESLGLKKVSIMPFTDNPVNKYEEASIYVLPSRQEGFPLVLLEAANMSLPVVAFDCTNGPREIIEDGINGFLVEPNNIQLFAKKLQLLISDERLRNSMGSNALDTVAKFKKDFIVNQWEVLFDSILTV